MPTPALVSPEIVTPEPPPPTSAQIITLQLSRGSQVLDLPLSANVSNHVWCVAPGIEGLDIPATEILENRLAGMFGSFYVGTDVPAREIFLPLMVRATDMLDWFAKREVFNKLTAPYADLSVRLTATRPDGTQRWIDTYRKADGVVWDLNTWIPRIAWQKFGVTFYAPDPWFRGTDVVKTWVNGGTAPNFFPILPVELAPSRILGQDVQVEVGGDIRTPPLWTISGPMTSITATHVDTGREWTLTAELDEGETAIVNTDPRAGVEAPRVQGPGGVSWWQYIEQPYDLWSLPIGTQTININVGGAGPTTAVEMRIPTLWETI